VDAVRVSHLGFGCLERSEADTLSGRAGAHDVTGLDDICHDVRENRRWVVSRSVESSYV